MQKKTVTMGHMQKLHMNIDGLFKDLTLDDQKAIALYVGQAGTGKTFLLIMQWMLGTLGGIYLASSKSMAEYEKALQFLLDKSFDDQKFTGKIDAVFEYLELSFELVDGKVKDLDIILTDNSVQVEPEGMPVFMSKNTRILFIERMLARLSNPNFKIRDAAKKSFIETMKKEIVNVTYDENNCSFTVHEIKDGKEITYPATTLSSGEQAWLNMFIQM